MPTIRLIEESEASPDVKVIYDDIKRYFNLDFVPSVYKAAARNPETLKEQWESYKELEKIWGKEMVWVVSLAVDITNACPYCVNFDIAMLKQLGYDDAKIDSLLFLIGSSALGTFYVTGLQLEPDVTPAMIERKMAA